MGTRASSRVVDAAERRRDWIASLAIVVVALAASVAGIANQFANDDVLLIEENARVHGLSHLGEIFVSPYWPPPYAQDLYRPFALIAFAIQYVAGNGDPLVFRVVSYALYAAVAVAVFLLARRVLPRTYAIAAALLFAAHPVHVEAVALAVAQSELLVALIAIAMVTSYLRWRSDGGLTPRRWAALAAWYGTAILLKEHGFILPGLLLAAEIFLVAAPRPMRDRVIGAIAFGAVGSALLLVRRAVLRGFAGTFAAPALVGTTVFTRGLTLLQITPEWIRLMVWPVHLRADYSPREFMASTEFGAPELLGLSMIVAIVALIWSMRRRAPVVSFGLSWFAIGLFPVSNVLVPTGILIAERTLFLPSVGFVIAMVALAAEIRASVSVDALVVRRIAVSMCALAIAAGIARSAERHRVWRNDGFLSIRTVQNSPNSFKAQRAYGNTLFWMDQPAMGVAAYERAIELGPADQRWRMRNELARHFRERGERGLEAAQLIASLAEKPNQDEARGRLVVAYLELGNYMAAERQADTAIVNGGAQRIYGQLKSIADSANRVGAPPGSINIGLGP
jgi:hypothetical protein